MQKFTTGIKLTAIIMLMLVYVSGFSKEPDENTWFSPKDKMIGNTTYFQLLGGAVYSNMSFTNKEYKNLQRGYLFLPEAGCSFRFQRGTHFSFSTALSYYGQGLTLKEGYEYNLRLNYIGLRIPVEIQFPISKNVHTGITKLFFFAGPYIATPFSGSISVPGFTQKLKFSDINKLNWGAEAGMGIRIPTFSLEGHSNMCLVISYLRGFSDTYTSYEKNATGTSSGEDIYIAGGQRYNNGIKLTFLIELPMHNKKTVSFTAGGDGKKNYKRVIIMKDK